jgi:hypothetical protein
MQPELQQVNLSTIIFDKDVYPRKTHDPQTVQRYAACLDEIEARGNYISVATDMTLLDGQHRLLAYQKEGKLDRVIPVYVYAVTDKRDKFALAVELNSTHGDQLSQDDKRSCVIKMYGEHHFALDEIAKAVSVRKATALDWTRTLREEEERRQNETIFDMWLACYTLEEIAEAVGMVKGGSLAEKIQESAKKFPGTKSHKLGNFDDAGDGFDVPIYNVWAFAKKTNQVEHYGNSEQRILENLLYLYTKPYDIVFDPFGGGGATVDVCKHRLRRYFVSDRKPIVERAKEIRLIDIVKDGPPRLPWGDVTLVYLDPPYWRQALNQYSMDADDLANMGLAQFTKAMTDVITKISQKITQGRIAMLMQPTQWNADERQYTDHIFDIVAGVRTKRLVVENRVSCPYSTQQCNPQMVEWAKANRQLLVLSRELVIWKVMQ